MTLYDEIKELLENNVDARERRYRSRYIVDLVMKKYGKENIIPVSDFVDMATEYASYIRMWQMVQKNNPHLHGFDYEDGKILAQEHCLSNGYTPMFERDNKMVKQLSL